MEGIFENINMKYLIWKWNMEYSWKRMSSQQKLVSTILFGSSATLLSFAIYKLGNSLQWFQPCAVEFDYGIEKVISKRRKTGIPPGLYNEGNTCFVNSTLQALASFSKFLDWIEVITQKHSLSNQLVFDSLKKLMIVLMNKGGNEEVYSAADLMNSLRGHGWVISNEQHDAYEFYQSLVSTLEEEVTKTTTTATTDENKDSLFEKGSLICSNNIANRAARRLPIVYKRELTNPLKGSLANRMSCLTCGHQFPVKFQSFNSLILNLQNISPFGCTLETCLKKFTECELLTDVSCDECGKKNSKNVKRTFASSMSLAKLPPCLCIELQRTFYDEEGRTLKNSMFVSYPEYLDLTQFTYRSQITTTSARSKSKSKKSFSQTERAHLLGENFATSLATFQSKTKTGKQENRTSPVWYRLTAVILHFGDAYDGHFVTYRRSTKHPDKWVYISDENVKCVTKESVFRSSAYLLFYEKCYMFTSNKK